jgi:hypothetical protein
MAANTEPGWFRDVGLDLLATAAAVALFHFGVWFLWIY